jgi:hypothetical protein
MIYFAAMVLPRNPARKRLPVVGVMGSGVERHDDLAVLLGRWIAERGAGLAAAVERALSVP